MKVQLLFFFWRLYIYNCHVFWSCILLSHSFLFWVVVTWICLKLLTPMYPVFASELLNAVERFVAFVCLFLHAMSGLWTQIIESAISSFVSPAPLKSDFGARKPLKEMPASCSCCSWRFLLCTLDGWFCFSWLSPWILNYFGLEHSPDAKTHKQLNELLLYMPTFTSNSNAKTIC